MDNSVFYIHNNISSYISKCKCALVVNFMDNRIGNIDMKRQLIESCRKAIESGRCLGCTALGDENFIGNINCKYSKIPTAQESIRQIKMNLGIQEKMKL